MYQVYQKCQLQQSKSCSSLATTLAITNMISIMGIIGISIISATAASTTTAAATTTTSTRNTSNSKVASRNSKVPTPYMPTSNQTEQCDGKIHCEIPTTSNTKTELNNKPTPQLCHQKVLSQSSPQPYNRAAAKSLKPQASVRSIELPCTPK